MRTLLRFMGVVLGCFFSVSATCVGYFNSLYYAAVQFHPPLVELLAQLKGPFKHCTRWIFFCVSRQIISELSTEGTIRNSALINIASVSLLTHDTLKYQSSFWCLWLITTFIHSFIFSFIHSFIHTFSLKTVNLFHKCKLCRSSLFSDCANHQGKELGDSAIHCQFPEGL